MFRHISVLFLFAFCTFVLMACSKSNSGGGAATPAFCDGVSSKYSTDVQAIISTSCLLGSNCHSTGSTNAGGELTDYIKVFNKRDAIKAAVNSGVMPQTGSLTTEQKKKIICWIDAGAANN